MTPHDRIHELLTLGAAGLLGPDEEPLVREHLRNCAECCRRTAGLAEVANSLRSLPVPAAPAYLAARTQAILAVEMSAAADRRRSNWLLAAAGAVSWAMAISSWYIYRLVGNDGVLGWAALLSAPALVAGPVAAAVFAARNRNERRAS